MPTDGYSDDLPFDLRPAPGATAEDMDLEFVERHYLPGAVSAETLRENRRTLADQMRSLRLMSGDVPTNGAMLAFGRDPQWWLLGSDMQYVRFDGDEHASPIKASQRIAGRLNDMLTRINMLLTNSIETRLDLASGPHERQLPDYPIEALRQLAFNAVMHRSYEHTHAPTRLYWFSQRVEIESPGGLFGRMTPENLTRGATDYRNRLVAEIMRNLGFVQRFGVGIPRALKALSDNGNPEPEFDADHSRVLVTVRSAR